MKVKEVKSGEAESTKNKNRRGIVPASLVGPRAKIEAWEWFENPFFEPARLNSGFYLMFWDEYYPEGYSHSPRGNFVSKNNAFLPKLDSSDEPVKRATLDKFMGPAEWLGLRKLLLRIMRGIEEVDDEDVDGFIEKLVSQGISKVRASDLAWDVFSQVKDEALARIKKVAIGT